MKIDPSEPFDSDLRVKAAALAGPVAVLGASGFIGINLLRYLAGERNDVFGVSQNPKTSWRLVASGFPAEQLLPCDIGDYTQLRDLLGTLKPRTVFNLAAYGAYSRQREYRKIYSTNFNAQLDVIELLKGSELAAYVYAGSSSEYGLNSDRPDEESELVPNSHYAVSKVATSYAIKYYGTIEELPVVNLRLYSAYGPWEEPDRLIPTLVSCCRNGTFPPLVHPDISRDFINVNDVVAAFVLAAEQAPAVRGRSFNIGTGTRTTIRELSLLVKQLCNVPGDPVFGTMEDRRWDMPNWYANPRRAQDRLGWRARLGLAAGLRQVIKWQNEVDFDHAFWNFVKAK